MSEDKAPVFVLEYEPDSYDAQTFYYRFASPEDARKFIIEYYKDHVADAIRQFEFQTSEDGLEVNVIESLEDYEDFCTTWRIIELETWKPPKEQAK